MTHRRAVPALPTLGLVGGAVGWRGSRMIGTWPITRHRALPALQTLGLAEGSMRWRSSRILGTWPITRHRALRALLTLVLVGALAGGAVGGCSGPDRSGVGAGAAASPPPGDPAGSAGPGAPGEPGGPAGSGTGEGAVGGSGPNTTDIAWLQLLIAMNERLLPIFDLVPARSSDPAVQLYASVARRARAAELESLRKLAAGVDDMPTDNPHLRHDMPGMPTAAQRGELARASGKDFDRGFAAAMIAHLDQTSRLCTGEQKSGADPAFRSLAGSIARGVGEERARASALDARAASPGQP